MAKDRAVSRKKKLKKREERAKRRPPCGYKGGKRRFGPEIARYIMESDPERIYDVGAGSAAVSLALVDAGYPASRLVLVEAGPWGAYWHAASKGTLDLARIETLFGEVSRINPRDVKAWVEGIAETGDRSPEIFLLLQAAAFGSEAVWHDGGRWRRGSVTANRRYAARGYWEPGPTSAETKPRGTIFTPQKIISRARQSALALRGSTVIQGRAETVDYREGAIYIDPDYGGVSGYGWQLDVAAVLAQALGPVYVSEQSERYEPDRVIVIGSRKGGALAGRGAGRAAELLLCF